MNTRNLTEPSGMRSHTTDKSTGCPDGSLRVARWIKWDAWLCRIGSLDEEIAAVADVAVRLSMFGVEGGAAEELRKVRNISCRIADGSGYGKDADDALESRTVVWNTRFDEG